MSKFKEDIDDTYTYIHNYRDENDGKDDNVDPPPLLLPMEFEGAYFMKQGLSSMSSSISSISSISKHFTLPTLWEGNNPMYMIRPYLNERYDYPPFNEHFNMLVYSTIPKQVSKQINKNNKNVS